VKGRATNMPGEAGQIHSRVAQLAERGLASGHVAASASSTWMEISSALTPVLGPLGVAALYRRSLHLAQERFSWLALNGDRALVPVSFDELHSALENQAPAAAAAANAALLQAFFDLLIRLVGVSLTDRLLRPVWDNPSDGSAAQDTTT
jgi:hypothetical protein